MSWYSVATSFENERNVNRMLSYLASRWTDSLIFSAIYVIAIFTGRHLMRNRQPFDLRLARVVWNGSLALFSILGTYRLSYEFIHVVNKHSVHFSLCHVKDTDVNILWGCLFSFSKVVELGDTLFIILRKQPLIFLHWYHHITVLVYVWFSMSNLTSTGHIFAAMNFVAHSLVYIYYTLAALRIRIPMFMKIMITCVQILQMVIGVSVNIRVYLIKSRGGACGPTYENILVSSIMYFSYFLLFAHFFHSAYLKRKEGKNKLKSS